jgi:DtxR family Mn-dependent transcriptional regulator
VHDEAERLEHAASDELIDRMAEAIGEPATDPHGAPIPTREGRLEEPTLVPLASLEPGKTARVERVSDRNAERLRYLAELGIVPGVDVRIVAREPFEGPIALQVHKAKRTVSPGLAAQILVTLLPSKGPRSTR